MSPTQTRGDRCPKTGVRAGALDKRFTAVLEKSANNGGWTYVVMSDSVEFFETRGKDTGQTVDVHLDERIG